MKFPNSTASIDIRLTDFNIDTTGEKVHAIEAVQERIGNIAIAVRGGVLTTNGHYAHGIYAFSNRKDALSRAIDDGNPNAILIDVRNVEITATGKSVAGGQAYGVFGHHSGIGDLRIRMQGGSTETTADEGHGIYGFHHNPYLSDQSHATNRGNVSINVWDHTVRTQGKKAHAVRGWHTGMGRLDIKVLGGSLHTKGDSAYAVEGRHGLISGLNKYPEDVYGLSIDVRGVDIRTEGKRAFGILGYQLVPVGQDTRIALTGGSISTRGEGAVGIVGLNTGDSSTGDVTIGVAGGAAVTTEGAGAHGLYAGHSSGKGDILVRIGAGSSVTAKGRDASGVQIGRFDSTTNLMAGVAGFGPDGFRRQTVLVDGSVMGGSGNAAGIKLVGGGRVFIGPRGTVGAASGISVHAARNKETDPAPALHLELSPGGRTMAEVLQYGSVRNDGDHICADPTDCIGGTTIVMNGVKLHDRRAGATGLWAPNGPWEVRLGKFSGANLQGNGFISRFTAQGTVYEALPRFLFRFDRLGSAFGEREPRPGGKSNWFRFSGASDAFDAKTATVSTRYRNDRLTTETGRTFRLGGGASATLGLRVISGAADAKSAGRRGGLDALGRGLTAGWEWNGGTGSRIAARVAVTRYELDVETEAGGAVVGDISATVRSFRVEASRRTGSGNRLELLGWLRGSKASVDGFADGRDSRIPAFEEGFLAAGASAALGTELNTAGGSDAVLRGTLGFERILDGNDTAVPVSSRILRSSERANRVLLDLEAVHPLGENGSVGIGIGVRGIGSGNTHITVSTSLNFVF